MKINIKGTSCFDDGNFFEYF